MCEAQIIIKKYFKNNKNFTETGRGGVVSKLREYLPSPFPLGGVYKYH